MTSRLFVLLAAVLSLSAGCSNPGRNQDVRVIKMNGSSTVFPIAEAVAEELILRQKRVRVTVGLSGTGGGFKKLCRNEIDVTNASPLILAEEMERCRRAVHRAAHCVRRDHGGRAPA
jgi:phosphate transport system substrate-binding protein